jgi:aminoglycoside/choline kinase family phosphotransferase
MNSVELKTTTGDAPDGVLEYLERRYSSAFRVDPLSGDASTRRYFRVVHPGGRSVLALYPDPFAPRDLPFLVVGALLKDFGLPVPEVEDEDGTRGIMLLEDLGDRTLQEALRSGSDEDRDRWYDEALDQLVTLQRAAASAARDAVCFHLAFDIEKLVWELHYFEKHFLVGHRRRALSVDDQAQLAESYHALAAEIASWPRVLCHRDFHSRNLIQHRDCLYWIDFQDARLGPATYDLASLLRDSYVDLSEDLVAEKSERFRRAVCPEVTPDEFARRFDLTCLQRNIKALGTFGFMASVRDNPVYLRYVPATLAHVARNLARHQDVAALRRVLARHLEELA